MLRTQVYLPEELHQELMLLAKSTGVNFSSLIREGAQEVINKKRIKQKKAPLKLLLGAGSRKGPKNLSKEINRYLYG